MAMEHLKELTRKMFDEVMNRDNPSEVDTYVAPNFVEHETMPPGIPQGVEGLRQFLKTMRHDFPNLRFDIQDLAVEGDKVWVRSIFRGTSTGEFMGVPVTGRNVDTAAIDILRFEGDKVVEHWGVTDMSMMMQQLGMNQMPGEPH
jgi:predicted ester cyclase